LCAPTTEEGWACRSARGGDVDGTPAFSWVPGTTTDLGTLGGASSTAIAVNAAGQIVGASLTPTGETHAFIWKSGTMTDLGTLGGSGSVAGPWQAGSMRDLGASGGPPLTGVAIAISPSAVVAGNSTAGAFVFDPITWPGP
jgi:probable HAF family extracellular repeat protein